MITINNSNTIKNMNLQFTVHTCKINNNDQVITLYEIENVPCHRLFKCHFLGCFANSTSKNIPNFTYTKCSRCRYVLPSEVEIVFYSWEDRRKDTFTLNEEPLYIYN